MKSAPLQRAAGETGGGPSGYRSTTELAAKTGLWVLTAVLSVLFTLLLFAYVIRMSDGDWRPLAVPWQLWMNTGVLILGSIALQHAATTARRPRPDGLNASLLASGLCGLAFLAGQLWAWERLNALNHTIAANPANSFFYLLTGLHGVHVIGGLVALTWGVTLVRRYPGALRSRLCVTLCARYWHFLLAVWLVLFSALMWITPEIARNLCGVS
ncbi:cytochrome c oxidase subunit 3 [Burkholderia sp. L27(2015)]|uniref:cytochrome c oxidase subunit 3 n=1 Tax=Burkholderia sp. L27(2015) TaxID=1641858 RepID=UPI00131E4ECB|nr:cytochrome c oxidase subunit 3 [Burkholderia sp. L27(2015)]